MKKLFRIILLTVSYVYVHLQLACNETTSPSEEYCRILPTYKDYTHCCFVESESTSQCRQLTDDEYENVKRYKDVLKTILGNNVKIKCSGEFLTYSLFAILALLL